MSYRKKILLILLVALLITISLHLNRFFTSLGNSLYYFSLVVSFVLFVMAFLKEEVFNTWKKFTIIYVFVSMLIIIFSSDRTGFIPFNYRDFFSYYLPISLFATSIFMTTKYTYKWSLPIIILFGHFVGMIIWYIIAVVI